MKQPGPCRLGIARLLSFLLAFPLMLCLTAWLPAEELRASHATLLEQYHGELEQLAARCVELGLDEQARQTRRWIVRRYPERRYLFLPDTAEQLEPASDQPRIVQQWYAKLKEVRARHAQQLFKLAAKAATEDAMLAYQWIHEVLHEDPDHAAARRVLGYRHVNGKWRRPERITRVRQANAPHPQLGWPRRSYWWIESEHYRVATNHSPEAGVELVNLLEELHDAWQQLFFEFWSRPANLVGRIGGSDVSLGSTIRHDVVLLRSRDDYVTQLQAIEPQIAVSLGYYMDRMRIAFFYLGEEDTKATWYHEATHQLFQERPGIAARSAEEAHIWAIEGIALYMESLRKHNGYVTLGGFDADRLQFARYRLLNERFFLPLESLVRYDRQLLQQDSDIRRLYTQAAGLSHFYMDYEGARYADTFREYLHGIYAGRSDASALLNLAGSGSEGLLDQYRAFLDVEDQELKYLLEGPSLQNLCLGHTSISDEGLQALEGQHQLQWLDLAYTKVTDQAMRFISDAKLMRQLNLEHTQISDAALDVVQHFKSLEELDLSGTNITDEGLPKLTALQKLKVLWLTSTGITDAGLRYLADLKQLEMLDVSHTAVTPQAWASLKAQLPALEHE